MKHALNILQKRRKRQNGLLSTIFSKKYHQIFLTKDSKSTYCLLSKNVYKNFDLLSNDYHHNLKTKKDQTFIFHIRHGRRSNILKKRLMTKDSKLTYCLLSSKGSMCEVI